VNFSLPTDGVVSPYTYRFMLVVMVVAHLGRYGNKPLILAISCLLSGVAIFLFAVPHFIYGAPASSLFASSAVWNDSSTLERRPGGRYEVCARKKLLSIEVGPTALA